MLVSLGWALLATPLPHVAHDSLSPYSLRSSMHDAVVPVPPESQPSYSVNHTSSIQGDNRVTRIEIIRPEFPERIKATASQHSPSLSAEHGSQCTKQTLAFGILGWSAAVLTALLFLSPLVIMRHVGKMRNVEAFSIGPYLFSAVACGVWIVYSLPSITPCRLQVWGLPCSSPRVLNKAGGDTTTDVNSLTHFRY